MKDDLFNNLEMKNKFLVKFRIKIVFYHFKLL